MKGKRGKQRTRTYRSCIDRRAMPEERIVERTCSIEENEISDSASHSKLPL